MIVRDNTLDGLGYDAPGAASSSGAADPELMRRLLAYAQPTGAFGGAFNNIRNWFGSDSPPPPVLGGSSSAGNDSGFNNPYTASAGAPPVVGGGGTSGGGGASSGIGSPILPQARGVMPVMGPPQGPTPWFPHTNTPTMAIPSSALPASQGGNRPLNNVGIRMAQPDATIPPNAVGLAPSAAASNPFIALDYRPNANPGTGGGMLGGALASPRGQGGAPIATALDLSHLFGGGQPAAAPLPKKKINVGKIPDSATAEVPPDTTSKAPWNMGPLQKGNIWKSSGGPRSAKPFLGYTE